MDSIKSHIIRFLEEQGSWVLGGIIDREINYRTQAKESNVSRRCRELVKEGVIQRDLIKIGDIGPKVVRYRIIREMLLIPSATQENKDYEVSFIAGGNSKCTCEGFKYRGSCKHVKELVDQKTKESMNQLPI